MNPFQSGKQAGSNKMSTSPAKTSTVKSGDSSEASGGYRSRSKSPSGTRDRPTPGTSGQPESSSKRNSNYNLRKNPIKKEPYSSDDEFVSKVHKGRKPRKAPPSGSQKKTSVRKVTPPGIRNSATQSQKLVQLDEPVNQGNQESGGKIDSFEKPENLASNSKSVTFSESQGEKVHPQEEPHPESQGADGYSPSLIQSSPKIPSGMSQGQDHGQEPDSNSSSREVEKPSHGYILKAPARTKNNQTIYTMSSLIIDQEANLDQAGSPGVGGEGATVPSVRGSKLDRSASRPKPYSRPGTPTAGTKQESILDSANALLDSAHHAVLPSSPYSGPPSSPQTENPSQVNPGNSYVQEFLQPEEPSGSSSAAATPGLVTYGHSGEEENKDENEDGAGAAFSQTQTPPKPSATNPLDKWTDEEMEEKLDYEPVDSLNSPAAEVKSSGKGSVKLTKNLSKLSPIALGILTQTATNSVSDLDLTQEEVDRLLAKDKEEGTSGDESTAKDAGESEDEDKENGEASEAADEGDDEEEEGDDLHSPRRSWASSSGGSTSGAADAGGKKGNASGAATNSASRPRQSDTGAIPKT